MSVIIFIPFIIVNIFIRDDEIKFIYQKNMTIRVKKSDDSIEEVPMEEYIIGVLAGEMPISFDIEALKAQAVASRSYVMKKMAYNKDNDYDVVDTVDNQVYLDQEYLKQAWSNSYVENINKLKKAVLETSGEYLEYQGQVVEAFFFSTSCGKTENANEVFGQDAAYLKSVDSSFEEGVSPLFEKSLYLTKASFCEKLKVDCTDLTIKVLDTTSTGRIKNISINDTKFTGESIRSLLNLYSSYFKIDINNNEVKITTKGYGHGVGMSQYGALALALKGKSYEEILKYYYQGVEIKKI